MLEDRDRENFSEMEIYRVLSRIYSSDKDGYDGNHRDPYNLDPLDPNNVKRDDPIMYGL